MIYTIGEIVLDLIFKTFEDVKATPGGAMLNTSISLGRLNVKVAHISILSNDKVAELIINFLQKNKIDTKFINKNSDTKTTLALAFLNRNNDAEYSFYKNNIRKTELSFPQIKENSIILYGSFFSIDLPYHNQMQDFLKQIYPKQVVKIYDPNFRKPHLPQLSKFKPLIIENIKTADIVKGSDEDFVNIFNLKTGREVWNFVRKYGVKVLFYTKGDAGSEFFSENINFSHKINKIDTVSTVGAGDTYTAGVIYFLSKNKYYNINDVTISQWKECVNIAHSFAGEVCQTFENYLPEYYCENNIL
jgi:fructokinase